jgi:hypothetical protein
LFVCLFVCLYVCLFVCLYVRSVCPFALGTGTVVCSCKKTNFDITEDG